MTTDRNDPTTPEGGARAYADAAVPAPYGADMVATNNAAMRWVAEYARYRAASHGIAAPRMERTPGDEPAYRFMVRGGTVIITTAHHVQAIHADSPAEADAIARDAFDAMLETLKRWSAERRARTAAAADRIHADAVASAEAQR